uniref:Putative secreted protein n=1 Tax=Anopheles darlingi TaxID=43151 RepID=A0A2M4D2M0_ANODA
MDRLMRRRCLGACCLSCDCLAARGASLPLEPYRCCRVASSVSWKWWFRAFLPPCTRTLPWCCHSSRVSVSRRGSLVPQLLR